MDDRFRTLIDTLLGDSAADEIAALDDEALAETLGEITETYRAIRAGETEDVPADDVELLERLGLARQVVLDEQTRRTEAQAAADEALAALDEQFTETPPEPAPDGEIVKETERETETEKETVKETEKAEATAEPDPEPVHAAARPSLAQLAGARRPAESNPRPAPARTEQRWRLKGGSHADFADMASIAERMIEATKELISAPAGYQERVTVATFSVDRPPEMVLKPGASPTENQAHIEHVLDNPERAEAITAAGGWCAPAVGRYDLPSISTAERPFRDSLVRMGAERGTVSFVRAARLSSILANQAGAAVTTWENTTDQTPGGSTKTSQTHACRTIQTEELGAVVARMRFGNFQQRAFPEDVAHDIELVMARHARIAEVRLLDSLIADMNIDVTQTGLLGTARDVRHHFHQAAAEIRHTERMARGSTIRCAVNAVVLDMMQEDIVFQQASGELGALAVDEAFVRRMVDLATVTATYVLDTPTGSDAFVTNSDTQALADWPDDFEVPFWPDDSVVFADGGELNLGVVRDSTLNNTNDYEIFFETFEGLLWLGPYGKTLTLTTCPNGESQAATDETGALCSGS